MDSLTDLIKHEIKLQYRSVRQFALQVGIPLSTVTSALAKGVGGMSYDYVVQICEALGIGPYAGDRSAYLSQSMRNVLAAYASLDERGRHTTDTVLQVELLRCRGLTLQPFTSEGMLPTDDSLELLQELAK